MDPGDQILFIDLAVGSEEFYVDGKLYRIDPDGTHLAQLAADRKIRWVIGPSADGKQMALIVVLGGAVDFHMEIQVMNIDGTAARLVTNMGRYLDSGAWSPDGQYFAVFGYLTNEVLHPDSRYWVINQDGSVQLEISQFFDLMDPVWRP